MGSEGVNPRPARIRGKLGDVKPWVRGAVWVGVGALLQIVSLVWDVPIVVRGTRVPWPVVVIALGLLILAWDLRGARKAGPGQAEPRERRD